jgi:hypothetical protein
MTFAWAIVVLVVLLASVPVGGPLAGRIAVLGRYGTEFAAYAPDRRVTLSFPSPFLRNEPATIVTRGAITVLPAPGAARRSSPTPADSRVSLPHFTIAWSPARTRRRAAEPPALEQFTRRS